jgi:hypothetical protein
VKVLEKTFPKLTGFCNPLVGFAITIHPAPFVETDEKYSYKDSRILETPGISDILEGEATERGNSVY